MHRKILLVACALAAMPGAALAAGDVARPSDFRLPGYVITPDAVREGSRSAEALSETRLRSNDSGSAQTRELSVDLTGLPVLHTEHHLLATLYRMALEEARQDVRPDGALMAGREWPGVWTRDVSYSTQLALALLMPDAAKRSLLAKTFDGRVRQDTGSGGAWPVSTDRVVWTVAAWEIYKATGDRAWLARAYAAGCRMAEEDWRVAHDPVTGLMRGESSFMDWREQTYPTWMEPVDIFQARALGTNVLHAEAYRDLARMAQALQHDPGEAARWAARATGIQAAINRHLWDARAGLYRAFLYPEPDNSPSNQTEALGNALAVQFGVANARQARSIATHYPATVYGVPTIYPEQPHPDKPYHNKAVWPFVESYWALASATAGNSGEFERSLASVMRSAALFQTNKENFVFDTGRAAGTAVNSDRQLWSVAGFLAIVYKGLFGLHMDADGFRFAPNVPDWIGGRLALDGLKVRGATLDLEVIGSGTVPSSQELDGRPLKPGAALSYALVGRHHVRLTMAHPAGRHDRVFLAPGAHTTAPWTPEQPTVSASHGQLQLTWPLGAHDAGLAFTVARDGMPLGTTRTHSFSDPAADTRRPHDYTVWATDTGGLVSAHSRPASFNPPGSTWSVASPMSGRWSTREVHLDFPLPALAAGPYTFRLRYANGSGPINTDSRCALRSFYMDGRRLAAVVMPQRGTDAWELWGLSSPVSASLTAGVHHVRIRFDAEDVNMDPLVNVARVEALEVVAR